MATVSATAYKTFGPGFENQLTHVKLTYDFANDGGEADDVLRLGIASGKLMVVQSLVHVETACVGASATVAIGIEGGDVDAFLDTTSGAVANLADDAVLSETSGQGKVIQADEYVILDIATADLTAGKINVHLWVMPVL